MMASILKRSAFAVMAVPVAVVSVLVLPVCSAAQSKKNKNTYSQWVYPGKDGKLVYKPTAAGDRILDFSYAGYGGGGVALPAAPVRRILRPSGQDDTQLIQAAIDEVAGMPADQGMRGTVLLSAGDFNCSGSLYLTTSGVILQGSGSGKGGTTIHMTGEKHQAIMIGSDPRQIKPGETAPYAGGRQFEDRHIMVTDTYVPAGISVFTVADASELKAGDEIGVVKPITAAWIHFMGMDDMVRNGKAQTWINPTGKLVMLRRIVSISGNKVTIDIPLADSYDAQYGNPPGMYIARAKPLERITKVGVEKLHIQCPPLEIAYGDAPYSGIRVAGDDCWVKDVYCEETMNTTTLAGNRITMQQVIVTHTYPNLGASKPTDFSIEGSQILLDRCGSSGGNTYFVWTAGQRPGPNVLLNCNFRGTGSRVQPHMRWSTGLLVDNCRVPDGGIDFMNRGVAGSGHGWTMGWAVAWNCIAKTYIIQNPPGVANWAIGCIGERQRTARLFDSSPLLPEGEFDAHGTPVAPQSLYLAQLLERLGPQALRNIGYPVDDKGMLAAELPLPSALIPMGAAPASPRDPSMGEDLAYHRPVNPSSVRDNLRRYAGEKALDDNDTTWWSPAGGKGLPAFLEVDMEGPVDINAVELKEAPGSGSHIKSYKVEGQVESDWKPLSAGTVIGDRKVDHFPKVTVWKVRVTILESDGLPALSKIGLYLVKENNL